MKTELLVIFMVLLIVGQPVVQYILKKSYQNKIYACFKSRDYERLDKILNSKILKWVFSPFNVEYCRLNEAILRDHKKMIDRQFDILLRMKLNDRQKQDVYLTGFNYYLSASDHKRMEKFYKLSMSLKNAEMKNNIALPYNTFYEKGYKYLDETLRSYENCAEEEKYINEYLLSVMYENKGDAVKAKYFKELADRHKSDLQ